MPLRRNRIITTLFCLTVVTMPALPMVATATETPAGASATTIQGKALLSVHNKILRRHVGVRHLSVGQFAQLHSNEPERLLVLDVREAKEHAVSHIKGAIRVPPGMSTERFMASFGDQLRGRKVVLYCSVGERSSQMAKQIEQISKAFGASGIYNLAGGIFNWHNQRRPLSNATGQTDHVHPYNWWWSRLVERRQLTKYEPQ